MTPETRRLVMDAVLDLRNPMVTALFALVDELHETELQGLEAECQKLHEELTEERAMEERPELIEAEESDQIDCLPHCKCSLIRTETPLADGRTETHVECPTCGDNWVETEGKEVEGDADAMDEWLTRIPERGVVKVADSPPLEVTATDDRFWDCECEKKFIHSKNTAMCPKCGARRDEQPDSLASEVRQTVQVAEDTSSEGGEAAIVPPSSQGDPLHHAPLSDEAETASEPIGGTFTLTVGDKVSDPLPHNASEAAIEEAVQGLASTPQATEPAPVLIETKPRAGLESLGSVEYLLISLDPEETVNVHRLHAAGVHRRYQALRNRIKRFNPQSVVAAITACGDRLATGTIRATFEPNCPEELFKDVRPFLDAWAKHLGSLTPMQVRDEKARLVARLTSMKGER